MEIIGFVIMFVAFSLAMAGGIGGGGVTVPINLIFFNFPFTNAVALSKICIFSGSLVKFIMDAPRKSPLKGEEQKPIID